jgi:hypothetical protein
MWKSKPKSKVSKLKAGLKSVRRSRTTRLDGRQVAQVVAALATAAAALAAAAAAFKKLKSA